MASDFDGMGDMTPSERMRAEKPSEPTIMTADDREALRAAAWARYQAGEFLTLPEFIAKHQGR